MSGGGTANDIENTAYSRTVLITSDSETQQTHNTKPTETVKNIVSIKKDA